MAYSVAFSPDGQRLAVPGPNGEAVIRNTATGEVISQLSGRGQRLKCVAFSEDGRLLATGSNDGTVQLWDGANGRSLAQPLGLSVPSRECGGV
jgi:WD40 repeat protein